MSPHKLLTEENTFYLNLVHLKLSHIQNQDCCKIRKKSLT